MGYVLILMLCMSNTNMCSNVQLGTYNVEQSCEANGKYAIIDSKKKPEGLQAVGFYCVLKT